MKLFFSDNSKSDDLLSGMDVTPTVASGAVPKHRATVILPAIVVPPASSSNRLRLGKRKLVRAKNVNFQISQNAIIQVKHEV